ncbi:hypothetical protein PCANC_01432 [Puccinia coronata f. sp. avenae]|uniref:Uncharacterized protein n=1 Tax=Puccinia coronata f. sp. avenae TaxID=200324 RepID=A0A2N5W2Z0_9BASI|nr:hypothetical protein PCANC_01432 [Puccinia coronata f. sp. avenae]
MGHGKLSQGIFQQLLGNVDSCLNIQQPVKAPALFAANWTAARASYCPVHRQSDSSQSWLHYKKICFNSHHATVQFRKFDISQSWLLSSLPQIGQQPELATVRYAANRT